MNIERVDNNYPFFEDIAYASELVNSLPSELLATIFSQLNQKDLHSVALVNRTFHQVAIAQTKQDALASVRKFVQTLVSNLDPTRHAEAILRLNAVGKGLDSLGIQTVLKSKYEERIQPQLEEIKQILQTLPAEELDTLFSHLDPRLRIYFSAIVLLSKKYRDLTGELKDLVFNFEKTTTSEDIQRVIEAGAIPTQEVLALTLVYGKAEWLKLFLEQGAIHTPSIFSSAIFRGNPEMVRLLLEYGATPTEDNWTLPLFTDQGLDTLKVLMECGFKCPECMLELLMASLNEEKLNWILISGTIPSTKALNSALRHGLSYSVIQRLLCAGAQVDEESIELALTGSCDTLQLLLNAGAVPNADLLSSLIFHEGSFEKIRAFIRAGVRPEALHLVAAIWEKCPLEVIQLLVNEGASPTEETLEVASNTNAPPEVMDYLEGVIKR